MKERGKWIIVHASALVWLSLGLIVVIVLNSVPKLTSSSPLSVRCGQPNVMLAIDLGIHPFWLSSATFTMDSTTGSSTLYVANVSREDIPTKIIDNRPIFSFHLTTWLKVQTTVPLTI